MPITPWNLKSTLAEIGLAPPESTGTFIDLKTDLRGGRHLVMYWRGNLMRGWGDLMVDGGGDLMRRWGDLVSRRGRHVRRARGPHISHHLRNIRCYKCSKEIDWNKLSCLIVHLYWNSYLKCSQLTILGPWCMPSLPSITCPACMGMPRCMMGGWAGCMDRTPLGCPEPRICWGMYCCCCCWRNVVTGIGCKKQ